MGDDVATAEAKAKERRAAPRHTVIDTHLVTVDLSFQSGALLLDLSATGIGVQALAGTRTGATTEFHFELPGTSNRIHGVGTVAWTANSGRVGIRFDEIADMCRPQLAQWLARERPPLVAPTPASPVPNWPLAQKQDEIALLRRDLLAQGAQGDQALAYMVQRIRGLTGASGAAIALQGGDGFFCRAGSGAAPAFGALLDPASGLSGECVRSGVVVRCEDTETDPRADRIVCRKLDLRSAVIVPVKAQARLIGVLEVFSSQAHGFQSSDILLLRDCAELVSELVTAKSAAPVAAPAPAVALAAPSAPPVEKAPRLPAEPPPAAPEVRANPAPAVAEAPVAYAATDVEELWEASDETVPAGRVLPGRLKLLAAALVVTVVAAAAWLVRDRLPFKLRTAPAPVTAATTLPTPPPLPAAAPVPEIPTVAPAATAVAPAKVGSTARNNVPVLVVTPSWPATTAAAPEPPPELVVPSNAAGAAADFNSVLSAPAAAPLLETSPPVSQGVTGGKLIRWVEPLYPQAARNLRLSGAVVLKATVDTRGRVGQVRVISGSPLLAAAAVNAVKGWRYQPFLLNGKPITAEVDVKVNFAPRQ